MRTKWFCLYTIFFLLACSKEKAKLCDTYTWDISIAAAQACGDGIIQIHNLPDDYVLSVDGRVTTDNTLVQLRHGSYKLCLQTGSCTYDTTVVIPLRTASASFQQVQQVLQGNCIGCHSGTNPQAGHDFTDPCTIIQQWQRIEARAVHGNPSPMPPTGLLPSAQRQIIIDWINSGRQY